MDASLGSSPSDFPIFCDCCHCLFLIDWAGRTPNSCVQAAAALLPLAPNGARPLRRPLVKHPWQGRPLVRPMYGFVSCCACLLPLFRGAAPLRWLFGLAPTGAHLSRPARTVERKFSAPVHAQLARILQPAPAGSGKGRGTLTPRQPLPSMRCQPRCLVNSRMYEPFCRWSVLQGRQVFSTCTLIE